MNETDKTCPRCGKPVAANLMGLCPQCLLKAGMMTESVGEGSEGARGGERFVPPSVEELGKRFGQLEILELIGRGGMGAVYKARQKRLDRVVALKILPPGTGKDEKQKSDFGELSRVESRKKEAEFAERFVREARALAAMSHPNIVTLYEFGEAEGLYFFLMEYVDGVNLRQLMAAGKLAPKEALAIVPHVCDALQYAHDRGIVHRDIKPENILIGRDGVVKIADFGVAKILSGKAEKLKAESRNEEDGAVTDVRAVGTPAYMAPEQVERPGEVDHRADIYSLGVVLYQMLTGELPGKRIEAPSRKVQIDVRIDEIVLRALEKEPERRYETAGVMKTVVETIAGNAELGMENAEIGRGQDAQQARRPTWHRFVAVVGTRGGKRVVNWPAVVVGALTMGLSGLVGILIATVARGGWPPGLGAAIGLGLILIPTTIGGAIWWGFTRMPLERLVRLDDDKEAQAPAHRGTQFSRTATIGAIWAVLGLVGILLVGNFTASVLVVALVIGAVAVGTTMLGWIAALQIQRSAGQLRGMGLAVFDRLLFPVILLDAGLYIVYALGGIAMVSLFRSVGFTDSHQPYWNVVWILGFSLFIVGVVIVDILVIRWVWRAVNKMTADAGSPIDTGTRFGTGRQLLLVLGGALLMACVGLVVWRVAFYTPPAGLPTSGWVQRAKSQRERAAGVPTSPWAQRAASPIEREFEHRLKVLGFEYDSHHIQFVDNTNKSIWRFSGLRRVVTNQSGQQTTTPQDGELVMESLDTGYRIRGSGDLRGLLDFDMDNKGRVRDAGSSAPEGAGQMQSAADGREFHDILIPDADTKGVPLFLDLATGQMLRPPEDVVGDDALRYYTETGKGDLGYDIDLIVFRGGKLLDAQGQPVPPRTVYMDSPRYDLAKLPQRVFVLTGNQRLFELRDTRQMGEFPNRMLHLRYAAAVLPSTGLAQSAESAELKALRKQKLEMAEARLGSVQAQADAGRVPVTDLAAAKRDRDVAAAELDGDPVKAAEARVAYADYIVRVRKAWFEAGRIGAKEYQDAIAELVQAQAEYERVKAAKGSVPSTRPAGQTQPAMYMNMMAPFGPALERELHVGVLQPGKVELRNCWIDFETGSLISVPENDKRTFWELDASIRDLGADATCVSSENGPTLRDVGDRCQFMPLADVSPDKLMPDQLALLWKNGVPEDYVHHHGWAKLPESFLFKLRHGTFFGVLDVVDLDVQRQTLKIRYRLVQAPTTRTALSPETSETSGVKALREQKLEAAEARLKRVEEMYKTEGASPGEYEQAKLDRDIAAAEIRGDQREVARLKLGFAEVRLKRVEELYKTEAASPLELEQAKLARDTAAAELRGDNVEIARLKYEYENVRLKRVEELRQGEAITPLEYEQAKLARDQAKAEYERMKAAKGSDGVPSTRPAAGSPFVKRQRFEPKAGMEKQTNWGVMDKPSTLNPEGWAIMAHMSLGGVVPARLPGETKEFCRIKMVDGNDDQITLQVEDVAKQNAMTVRINRDQYAEITVNGDRYRIMYPAVEVAVNEADTTPLALVIVTHADQKQAATTHAMGSGVEGKGR